MRYIGLGGLDLTPNHFGDLIKIYPILEYIERGFKPNLRIPIN